MSRLLEKFISSPVPPPFVFFHHPHSSVQSIRPAPYSRVRLAQIDTIEHHTPRLIYSGLVARLKRSLGQDPNGPGEIVTWDGFSHELRTLRDDPSVTADKKGKGRDKDPSRGANIPQTEKENWVFLISHAEKLPRILGPQWAVITRLSELVGIPATVVLASQTPWDILRPPLADAVEPLHVYLPALTRTDLTTALSSASPHPLWPHFINLILATLSPLVSPALPELVYLAAPLWTLYTSNLPPHREQVALGRPYPDPDDPPGPLEINVKLLTDLKYQVSLPLTLAIEHLIPRRIGPREFVQALKPSANPLAAKRSIPALPGLEMPIVARFLVLAGYLASQNPAKTDLRLFGRGAGIVGKRKRGGGTRRAGYGRVKVGKVPQRLVGPKPFPLDRLLAIFSSLYAEHADRPPDLLPSLDDTYDSSSSEESDGSTSSDEHHSPRRKANGNGGHLSVVEAQRAKVERSRRRDQKREERWEEEVEAVTMGVSLWSMIPELESQGLLKRMSPPDRLDNVMLRSEVDYETAKAVARELKIVLDEYLYEATN